MHALPDDGVTVTPKPVGAILMQILILFLRQLTSASVGENFDNIKIQSTNVKKGHQNITITTHKR